MGRRRDVSFLQSSGVVFSSKDQKKLSRMKPDIVLVSTVCPDYPHDGIRYTFSGRLGSGISLTAWLHLERVPGLLCELAAHGFTCRWFILVADLPECVPSQYSFIQRVAGDVTEYLELCGHSVGAISQWCESQQIPATVNTFTDFYSELGIDYLSVQQDVAWKIQERAQVDDQFGSKFHHFSQLRKPLAQKFRQRCLSNEELYEAAGHGMSLYVTHGTLLRSVFPETQLVVVNHDTPNLKNFYLADLVPGYENIRLLQNFPLGIIQHNLYS